MQEQFFPQMDPEPEMGAAAAAVFDTFPPLLRNPPPIPAETAQPSALNIILQAMNEMKTNAQEMNNKMDGMNQNIIGNMQMLREEMQCMVAGLQDGLDEVEEGQNQLKGEMEKNTRAVEQLKIAAGGSTTGDVLGETCKGDGGSDSDSVGKIKWGDGDVHEGDKARGGD